MRNSAKDFFQQIRDIDRQIDTKHERLVRLEALSTKTTATLSGDCGKPSGTSRTMENTVDKIIDLRNELNAEIDRLVGLKREADRILRAMPKEKERRCLENRYMLGKTFEAIAVEMGYSSRGIRKLHGRALQTAEIFFEKNREFSESSF